MDKQQNIESAFQRICGELVGREVEFNANDIIEGLGEDERIEAHDAPPDLREALNDNDGHLIEHEGEHAVLSAEQLKKFKRKRQSARGPWLLSEGVTAYNDEDEAMREWCNDNRVDTGDYRPEIYEFWAVSRWLYSKLGERGEHVFECGNHHIWGRAATGQAIKLDGVIRGIVREYRLPHAVEEGEHALEWLKQYETAKAELQSIIEAGSLEAPEREALSIMLTTLSLVSSDKRRDAEAAALRPLLKKTEEC